MLSPSEPFWAVLLVGAVLVVEGSCARSPSPTSPIAEAPTQEASSVSFPFHKILCFGDSITYGVTLRSPIPAPGAQGQLIVIEGYVPKLWRRLEAKYGPGFELVNAGAPGEGSRAAVARIGREMQTRAPDVVLLLEGVIDVDNDSPKFPAVRDNLREIVRVVQSRGAVLILGTYPLVNPSGFRATNPENIPTLNELVRRLAREEGIVVADHEHAFRDLSGQGPDGLHPNDIGYEVMADTWLSAIEALSETVDDP